MYPHPIQAAELRQETGLGVFSKYEHQLEKITHVHRTHSLMHLISRTKLLVDVALLSK